MMRMWVLVGLLLGAPALAQDGEAVETEAVDGAGPAAGDKVWLSEDTLSKRFFDEDASGAEFKKDARVTIVLVDGDRTRVMQGSKYGWVASSALTTFDPNPPALPPGGLTPPATFELPPGLDFGTP